MPWVLGASERVPTGNGSFSIAARAAFERLLLRRLAGLAARTLQLEFSLDRAGRLSALARLMARSATPPPRAAYDAFVERMNDGGLDALLAEYPVLRRLAVRVTELWIEDMAELTRRLEADRAELERTFCHGDAAGQVVHAEVGLSDPHRGGRMVVGLTFASGVKLAYKPKDIGSELAFNGLLQWFNERGAPLAFRSLTVLERQGYGWVEWVEQEPCLDAPAAERYYRRAGMLLCLVYVLAGSDCHRENILAAGEHPVLVDTESLLHHRAAREASLTGAWELARDQLANGVLATGMLPSWQVDVELQGQAAADVSGLHTVADHELTFETPVWDRTNSDGMTLVDGTLTQPLPRNQPTLEGRRLRLEDYAAELLDGFERFHRFLVEHREELLRAGGPLAELEGCRVRFLYRSTRVYGALLAQLNDPSYMREEDARRAELERLHGVPGDEEVEAPSRWRPLVEAEIAAMDQLDIPLFRAAATERVLELGDGNELHGCLREPSAELVRDRLRGLDDDDLERQLGFISGSLYANTARHPEQAAPGPSREAAVPRGDRLIESAVLDIAAQMARHAVEAPDGGASWIAPQYLPPLERYQLQPISFDLHSGACGIALFLAALEDARGGEVHGRLALAALEPVRRALAYDGDALATGVALGAATGLGSIVYSLTSIAGFLGDRALLEDAEAAAALLSDERVGAAPADVFAGLAGELLAQLALHKATGDAGALERASACGRQLLATRSPGGAGPRAWVTFKGRCLSGFSHGTAGIAYALARLHSATGDLAFGAAAAEAVEQEDELFDPDAGNWRDLRGEIQPDYRANWCHGAPGIGLARCGMLGAGDEDRARADVEAAVRLTLDVPVEGPDHLCCGNLGRAELLLVAGERLASPKLAAAGRERVEVVAARARAAGGFTLDDSLPRRVYIPGFFQGLAGVGYQLLRATRPDLPSALLWE